MLRYFFVSIAAIAAGGGLLHTVVVAERRFCGGGPRHAIERELHARIADESLEWRRGFALVGVRRAEISVQHRDLTFDLRVRDVLRRILVHDVHDDLDRHDGNGRDFLAAVAVLRRLLLELEQPVAERRIHLEQTACGSTSCRSFVAAGVVRRARPPRSCAGRLFRGALLRGR